MVLFDEDENKEEYDSSDELHVAVHSQQFILYILHTVNEILYNDEISNNGVRHPCTS